MLQSGKEPPSENDFCDGNEEFEALTDEIWVTKSEHKFDPNLCEKLDAEPFFPIDKKTLEIYERALIELSISNSKFWSLMQPVNENKLLLIFNQVSVH